MSVFRAGVARRGLRTGGGATVAIACALLAGLSFTSSDAHALGPVDIEAAAVVGGGTTPSHFGTNPLGFGVGGRGGVSIFGMYAGVAVIDYLGSTSTTSVLQAESVTTKVHSLLYGVEAGYGVKVSVLKLRAQVGVGNMDLTGGGEASGLVAVAPSTSTQGYLYVQPGILAAVTLGVLLLGADFNVLMLPSGPNATGDNQTKSGSFDSAFTGHVQAGVSF